MLTSRQIKRASEKGTFSATLAMVSAEGEDGLDGLIDARQHLGVWLKVIIDVVSC